MSYHITRRSLRSRVRGMIEMARCLRKRLGDLRGTVRALTYHMTQTIPAGTMPPAELMPLHVEALALYESVALGLHAALRPARVPS